MPEILLVSVRTIPVAASTTGVEEAYIHQALNNGRLSRYAGTDGEAMIDIYQLRGLLRTPGLQE